MSKHENEDLLKNEIFDIYSEWLDEPSTDRFIIYYQRLCKQIYLWCKDYLFRKIDDMGEEIAEVTKRIMERKGKSLSDKKSYFYYLSKALKNERKNFYRNYNSDDINIKKEMKSRIRASEDVLRMKKSDLGRNLTEDEKIQAISDWHSISIKRAKNIIKTMDISCIDFSNNSRDKNGNRIDILDSAPKSIYMDSTFINPHDEYLIKTCRKHIQEAIEHSINKKQKRARDCSRALITLHYIENYKNFEGLYPVLDSQILEICQKDDLKPYEIYQKYHPNVQKPGAEAMASKNLNGLIKDIEAYLEEKNK